MLKLENITFSYDEETEALKDISLNIEKGKKTVFLGENGSGKSTVFSIMNGLLQAQKGSVYLNGEKVLHKKKNLEELRKKVGIVFQDPEIQIFAPLVFQEVSYGPENLGYSKEKVEKKNEGWYKQYLNEMLDKRAGKELIVKESQEIDKNLYLITVKYIYPDHTNEYKLYLKKLSSDIYVELDNGKAEKELQVFKKIFGD